MNHYEVLLEVSSDFWIICEPSNSDYNRIFGVLPGTNSSRYCKIKAHLIDGELVEERLLRYTRLPTNQWGSKDTCLIHCEVQHKKIKEYKWRCTALLIKDHLFNYCCMTPLRKICITL